MVIVTDVDRLDAWLLVGEGSYSELASTFHVICRSKVSEIVAGQMRVPKRDRLETRF
jgi:hypothetical protein